MSHNNALDRDLATPTVHRFRSQDLVRRAARFLRSEDGPTAVEYAVMLALIVVVCLTAIRSVGTKANTTFSNVASSIAGTSS